MLRVITGSLLNVMPMSIKPQVNNRILPHTPMYMSDKSVIDESHPMIILKAKVICSLNQKFWMSYSNDHFFYKTMCLLEATNFLCLTAGFARLPTHSRLSPLETYQQHIPSLSPKGVSIPTCYYPKHIFISMYATLRLGWTSSNRTESTNQSPNTVLIHIMHSNPMSCDVPLHNAIRCATTCLCHATYVINATWTTQTTKFIMCHGQLY